MAIRLSVVKLLSILIVSGNAQKCNSVVSEIREWGFSTDPETQKTKSFLIKYGKDQYRKDFFRMGRELYNCLTPALEGVDRHFFGSDDSARVIN